MADPEIPPLPTTTEPDPPASDKRPAFTAAIAAHTAIKESLVKIQALRTTLRHDDELTGYDTCALEAEAAAMRASLFAETVLRDLVDRVAR